MLSDNIDMPGLERLLRSVEDRELIRNLTSRYNRAFDEMDVEGWVATFVDDGELILAGSPPISGHAALAAFHRASGFGKMHATVDHQIDLNGDRATQTCVLLLGERQADRKTGSARIGNTGRYHDEIRQTADGWRFVRRLFVPDAEIAT